MTPSNSVITALTTRFFKDPNSMPSCRNNFSGRFLIITKILNRFFIPVLGSGYSLPAFTHRHTPYTEIAISLFCKDSGVHKTFYNIITIGNTNADRNLSIVTTPNGERYFVGRGTILYEDFSPILIGGYFAHHNNPEDLVCLISPKIFSRDDFVSKYVRKNLLSFLSKSTINGSFATAIPSVIITEEIDRLIVSPRTPNTDVSATFNRALREVNL